MKTYFTGQDGLIKTWGREFAEFVYDKYTLGSIFKGSDIQFPPFNGLKSNAVYTRVLLAWMREQAPDCIEKKGKRYRLPPLA